MGHLELDWVNDGEPTTISTVSVAGRQRIADLRAEGAEAASIQATSYVTHVRAMVVTAKVALMDEGLDVAFDLWAQSLGSQYENLAWEKEEFEESLDQLLQDLVFDPLEVKTVDEAEKEIQKIAKETNERFRNIREEMLEWQDTLMAEEAFWYLWKAKPRPEWMPKPKDLPETMGELDGFMHKALTFIRMNIDKDDYTAIIRAAHGDAKSVLDTKELKQQVTEEVVAKKALSSSKQSKASSPSSAPSSGRSTEATSP